MQRFSALNLPKHCNCDGSGRRLNIKTSAATGATTEMPETRGTGLPCKTAQPDDEPVTSVEAQIREDERIAQALVDAERRRDEAENRNKGKGRGKFKPSKGSSKSSSQTNNQRVTRREQDDIDEAIARSLEGETNTETGASGSRELVCSICLRRRPHEVFPFDF